MIRELIGNDLLVGRVKGNARPRKHWWLAILFAATGPLPGFLAMAPVAWVLEQIYSINNRDDVLNKIIRIIGLISAAIVSGWCYGWFLRRSWQCALVTTASGLCWLYLIWASNWAAVASGPNLQERQLLNYYFLTCYVILFCLAQHEACVSRINHRAGKNPYISPSCNDPYCPSCGYSTAGLPSKTCPECGNVLA